MEWTCKGLSKYGVSFEFIILLVVLTLKSKTAKLQNYKISSGLRHQLCNDKNMNIAIPKCFYGVDGSGASSGAGCGGGCGGEDGGGRVIGGGRSGGGRVLVLA